MVVHKRGHDGHNKPDTQPHALAFQEEIDVRVALFRKRTRAGKHHKPERKEAGHGNCQHIDGVSMHCFL